MIIRKAIEEDIPEIIKVLKAGLGEVSSHKTEKVWRYKHIENPFGKSLVLVAVKDSKIVGVRAFMAWRWQSGEQIYKAYRAVDTATHPDYQRQGIFKKLTLKALEIAKEEGYDFVFNTPNEQSRPGYLKMGWEIVDKINVAITPSFLNLTGLLFNDKKTGKQGKEDIKNLCDFYNDKMSKRKEFFTPKTPEYIKWRYKSNPMINYKIIESKDLFIAYYFKKHKYFNELRISELLLNEKGINNKTFIKRKLIKEAFKNKALFISTSSKELYDLKILGKFGPVLTIRNLNLRSNEKERLKNIDQWQYELGDLELF